jgi:putative transposase
MSKKSLPTTYIRCSKITTKFANQSKLDMVSTFLEEYKGLTQSYADILWSMDTASFKKFLSSEILSIPQTWLSERMRQAALKQAKGIVVGTRKKEKERIKKIEKLNEEGKFKQARKLQAKHDKIKVSKPVIKNINAELDERFVKVDLSPDNSFDGWITIASIGRKMKIQIPFKRTTHFNEMFSQGKLKNGVRLGLKSMDFNFEFETPLKPEGEVIGIDIGKTNLFSLSNGVQVVKDNHGHTMESIMDKLARKKRGSKGYKRAAKHRDNFTAWSLNQINWNGVKEVRKENIKHIFRGKKTARSLSNWNYRVILDKVSERCQKEGVLSVDVNPAYTSQRCSACGWVQKSNRLSQSKFCCKQCSYTANADMNAAINISLPLSPIGYNVKSKRPNLQGFYWDRVSLGQERIVPDNPQNNALELHEL